MGRLPAFLLLMEFRKQPSEIGPAPHEAQRRPSFLILTTQGRSSRPGIQITRAPRRLYSHTWQQPPEILIRKLPPGFPDYRPEIPQQLP